MNVFTCADERENSILNPRNLSEKQLAVVTIVYPSNALISIYTLQSTISPLGLMFNYSQKSFLDDVGPQCYLEFGVTIEPDRYSPTIPSPMPPSCKFHRADQWETK